MAKKKTMPQKAKEQVTSKTESSKIRQQVLSEFPPLEEVDLEGGEGEGEEVLPQGPELSANQNVENAPAPDRLGPGRGIASQENDFSDPLGLPDPDKLVEERLDADPRYRESAQLARLKDKDTPDGSSNYGQEATRIKEAMNDMGFFEKMANRAKVSLGQDANQRFNILAGQFGRKNVKMEKGELFYRRGKDEPFRPFDEAGFSAADIADWSGDIIEMTLGIASEAALFVGTGGMGTAARVGARVAGIGGIGMAGSLARSGMADLAGGNEGEGIPDDFKELDRAYMAGFANLAGAGLGKALVSIGRVSKGFIDASPRKIVDKAAKINLEVDQMLRKIAPKKKTPTQVGDDLESAVGRARNSFGQTVGKLKVLAKEAVGNRPAIAPREFLETASRELRDYGVEIDPTTQIAKIGPDTLGPSDMKGKSVLKDMVEQYNETVTRVMNDGGLSIDRLDNQAQVMRSLSKSLEETIDPKERALRSSSFVKKLSKAMANDRDAAIVSALKKVGNTGAQEADQIVQDAFENYARASDTYNYFRKLFKSTKENGELFVDSLIKRGNIEKVRDIKRLVGPDSEDWQHIQTLFMDRVLAKNTSPTTGLLKIDGVVKDLSDSTLGKELQSEFISEGNFRRLRKLARDYKDVDLDRLMTEGGSELLFAFSPMASPFHKAKVVWQMFSSNADLVEELYERGFQEFAEKAQRKSGKLSSYMEWMGAKEKFGKLLFNARKEGNAYMSTPVTRTILRQTMVNGQQDSNLTIGDLEQGIDRYRVEPLQSNEDQGQVNPL